jgi:hypothetical protein
MANPELGNYHISDHEKIRLLEEANKQVYEENESYKKVNKLLEEELEDINQKFDDIYNEVNDARKQIGRLTIENEELKKYKEYVENNIMRDGRG